MTSIPDSHKDILTGKNFAHVATLMKNGAPQVTPVWIDFDGSHILFNTADGRVKARNLDRDARVALSIHDQSNPYRYLQVRGRVVEKIVDEGEAHINSMSKKYVGRDKYAGSSPDQLRVIYKIEPEHVQTMG